MNMKLLVTGFLAASIFAQPVSADETPLGEQMDIMNGAYKAMRREEDPAVGAKLAREAQDAMIKGIVELPEMLIDMPDGPEKEKSVALYRKMMGQLIVTLADMELAFHDGNMEKVAELVAVMRSSKKESHNRFIEE